MTNIIKFPRRNSQPRDSDSKYLSIKPSEGLDAKGKILLNRGLNFVWVLTALVWPFLKWLLSINVFFQMLRMIYYWNTPGIYAGWNFLLHFSVLTAFTYFVSVFKTKSAR